MALIRSSWLYSLQDCIETSINSHSLLLLLTKPLLCLTQMNSDPYLRGLVPNSHLGQHIVNSLCFLLLCLNLSQSQTMDWKPMTISVESSQEILTSERWLWMAGRRFVLFEKRGPIRSHLVHSLSCFTVVHCVPLSPSLPNCWLESCRVITVCKIWKNDMKTVVGFWDTCSCVHKSRLQHRQNFICYGEKEMMKSWLQELVTSMNHWTVISGSRC